MKKNLSKILFFGISILWLSVYSFLFVKYRSHQTEISKIKSEYRKVGDLVFLKKTVNSLNNEFQTIRMASFTSKSTSEFIAKLPRLAEMSGIKDLKLENVKVFNENRQEITELRILAQSRFPDVANFIELLERSKLPVKVSTIKMNARKKQLKTVFIIRIYKQMMEESFNGQ